MKTKKSSLVFILTLFLIGILVPIVSAATIHGSVYDIFLDELDKAVITIDSEPQQTAVSKGGEYSFEISPGEYIINAIYYGSDADYESEDKVSIKKEGNFKIDLILTPQLDSEILGENTNEFEELNSDFTLEKDKGINVGMIITLIAIILIILYFYLAKGHFIKDVDESELKSENEEELEKVLKFIKSLGGRATQKDIRKKFPSSEAKISLMISELESKNFVKKIKKGRGNIIIITKEGTKQ